MRLPYSKDSYKDSIADAVLEHEGKELGSLYLSRICDIVETWIPVFNPSNSPGIEIRELTGIVKNVLTDLGYHNAAKHYQPVLNQHGIVFPVREDIEQAA
jgi:methionine aminopeptidase